MLSTHLLIPVLAYGLFAVLLTVAFRRIGGLLGLLACSYCGVIALTFTRGTMGSFLLPQIFALLLAPFVIFRPKLPPWSSRGVTLFTALLFAAFAYGIVVGLGRYDPEITAAMRGRYTTVAGIPLSALMTGYRVFVLVTLALAFLVPLHYVIDRDVMRKCLIVSWLMTLALSVASFLEYFGVVDMTFEISAEVTQTSRLGEHRVVMGFRRAALGLMLVAGIFLSYGMTQLTSNRMLKTAAWCSAPILILALLFTWSRAAMLGMAVGSISLIITLGGARAIRGVVLSIFGVFVIAIVLHQFPDLEQRMNFFLTGEIDRSAGGRLLTWGLLLRYLFSNADVLIFGTGFQNFNYFLNISETAVGLNAAHNNYLHILAELGIAGLTIFLLWIVAIFVWLHRWRTTMRDRTIQVMTGIFMSLVIAVLVSSLTQESLAPSPSVMPWLLHFFLLLGLFVSWYRGETYTHQLAANAAPLPLRPEDLARIGAVGDPVVY